MKTKTDCGIIIDEYIQRKCEEHGGSCFVSNYEAQTKILAFGESVHHSPYAPDSYRRILEWKIDNSNYKIRKLTDKEKEKLKMKRGYTVYKCQLKSQCELF